MSTPCGAGRDRTAAGPPRLFSWALCLAIAGSSCAADAPRRPNVVLITLDTFRADLLTAYGAQQDLMPALNRFASEAVVFEDAVTPIGTTFPAHASLFTGLYPRQHGVRWNGDSLDQRFTTVAERLADAGYQTAAFVSMQSLLTRGGLGQGFDVQASLPADPPHFVLDAEEVNAAGLQWLAEERDDPFLVWFHYFETHAPYRLTAHARDAFARRGYQGPLAAGASTELFYSLGDSLPWSTAEREAVRTLYQGEAAHLDRALGDLLGLLRQSRLLERTLVVITADHGQALGEHDVVGHGFLLWQPVVAVPMLMRLPGEPQPRRITGRVGIIDLPATIMDLLDLPAMPGSGRSLRYALEGLQLSSRAYFAETRAPVENQPGTQHQEPGLAVMADQFKAIWWPGEWMWLNLDVDPLELGKQSSAVPQSERSNLERLLEEFRAAPEFSSRQPQELGSEAERELRALGYIE